LIEDNLFLSNFISVRQVSNLTSHHKATIFFLSCFTTHLSLSVPICGFALYIISLGAHANINSSNIYFDLGSFTPVYNFQSENVPAHHSPN
jgi:hypothetical protein